MKLGRSLSSTVLGILLILSSLTSLLSRLLYSVHFIVIHEYSEIDNRKRPE